MIVVIRCKTGIFFIDLLLLLFQVQKDLRKQQKNNPFKYVVTQIVSDFQRQPLHSEDSKTFTDMYMRVHVQYINIDTNMYRYKDRYVI